MARRIPADRFEQLVRGATTVFIERGYRRTQMADVAEAIGVAKGTVYGYVDSKDALFELCLRCADSPGPIPVPESLPLRGPAPGALGQRVKETLAQDTRQASLEAAMGVEHPTSARAEATAVIGELFDLMYTRRHGIKLLDRCMDHPELADLWQTMGREGVRVALARYLTHRAESGDFRTFDNERLAARFVLEACATWAVHIHWDRAPERYDAAAARANAIDFAVRGLLA
jgi:AcrR family transcriptional regulator